MTVTQKTYNLNLINIDQYKTLAGQDDITEQDDNTEQKITAKKCKYNDCSYTIVKYKKSALVEEEYSTLGLARSIIICDGNVVAFSPPKSLPYNDFLTANPSEECFAEDFIDGTMINLFYNQKINDWVISTRSRVGADTLFFVMDTNTNTNNNTDDTNTNNNTNDTNTNTKRTFKDMFYEAAQIANLDFSRLDNNWCYSFVLQHPNNRIVTPIDFPKLFLIRAYNINNETNLVTEVASEVLLNNSGGFWNSGILHPQRYVIDTYDNLADYYNNAVTPFYCVGIVVNSASGRTKIRNKNYETIRELRGNQSRLQYHYLTLRKGGRVREFLAFYPEFANHFSEYRKTIHEYTSALYSNYIKCFIRKERPLKEYPYEFKVHMFNLHQKYLADLKPNNGYIDKQATIAYFNGLHPSQQMHILNCRAKLDLDNRANLSQEMVIE